MRRAGHPRCFFFSSVLCFGWAAVALAQSPSVPPNLRIPGPADAQVERPVVVQGEVLLLGYPGAAQDTTSGGAVHVYRRSIADCAAPPCWVLTDVLQPDPSLAGHRFGASLAFDGRTAAIGAPSIVPGEESLYLYDYRDGQWTLRQRLQGDLAQQPTNFGRRVALDGNTVATVSVGYGLPGAVHVFARDNADEWRPEARLTLEGLQAEDQFGQSIALHENTLVVGANQAPIPDAAGLAFVFVRREDAWLLAQQLLAADSAVGDNFGHAVALHDDLSIVTSHVTGYGKVGPDTYGAAYMYRRTDDRWHAVRKLFPTVDVSWQAFGSSLALSDRGIAVTAARNAEHDGAIYWFEMRDEVWSDVKRYWVPDPPVALATDGKTLVATAVGATWLWDLEQ